MSAPSAVVFDLGKVLLDFDYGIAAAKIARRSRLTAPQVLRALTQSPLLPRFESGLLSNEEFTVEVCSACAFSGTLDEFHDAFSDIFAEIGPMTALNETLRANRIPTCIFSNTNGLAIGHIRQCFPFFARFDHYILSYEQGAMKPDAAIYLAVERALGLAGDAIVYLDDRAENVEGGLARGWRALLHETPEKTIPALAQLGLPVETNS
ncbi:MAG TPA: HAD family phosphatase [Candidatus Cybelea sp.]|nr:HAD family phosphatase [Candidatus Cybelea sp.]